MSGETLRRAAVLMRERAEATTENPWHSAEALAFARPEEDAEHIASWHPDVALAVADWLEVTASDVGTSSLAYHAALAVARAYLGQPS